MGASVMSMPNPSKCPITAKTSASIIAWAALFFVTSVTAAPEGPRLGRPLTHEEVLSQSINVFPDGQGLPRGKGTATEGKALYDSQCASCHGLKGSGGSAEELQGRSPLAGDHPDKTVGNYWPYATTLFDFIQRAMPLNAPRSLSDDQVYALTAYLLTINGIIDETKELNAKSLPEIKMPNREGFVRVWPEGGS